MAVSEFVEGLFEEAKGLLAREAKLAGLDGELGGERLEAADFFRAQQAGRLLADVAAAAGNGADDAVALEILEGAGDGVGVDAQLGGKTADGRKLVVVAERAGGDSVTDLGLDLEVNGNAGSGMDTEEHGGSVSVLIQ
jgi:hypothetical protein